MGVNVGSLPTPTTSGVFDSREPRHDVFEMECIRAGEYTRIEVLVGIFGQWRALGSVVVLPAWKYQRITQHERDRILE